MNFRKVVPVSALVLVGGLAAGSVAIASDYGKEGWGSDQKGQEYSGEHWGKHCKGKGGKGGPAGKLQRMMRHLDLSDDQQNQVDTIVKGSLEQFYDYKSSMRDTRKALKEAVMAESYDAQAVQVLAQQQGQTMAAMIVYGAGIKAEVMQVLTPEQRAEVKERMEKRGKWGGWFK